MSEQAVYGFIEKADRDPELCAIVVNAIAAKSEDLDLVKLASEHGFAFSREEGLKVWEEFQARGELPDSLLEVIAGGSPANCNNKDQKV